MIFLDENIQSRPQAEFLYSLQIQRINWQEKAPCFRSNEIRGDDFLDARNSRQKSLAERYCLECDYRMDCLAAAIVSKEPFGVWGGTTEQGRGKLLEVLEEDIEGFGVTWNEEIQYDVLMWCKNFVLNNPETVI